MPGSYGDDMADPHVIVLVGATGDLAKRKLLPGLLHLFKAGPPMVQSLVEAGSQHAVRTHDIETLEERHPRQKIEIGHEQPVGIGNPVRNGHDDVPEHVE